MNIENIIFWELHLIFLETVFLEYWTHKLFIRMVLTSHRSDTYLLGAFLVFVYAFLVTACKAHPPRTTQTGRQIRLIKCNLFVAVVVGVLKGFSKRLIAICNSPSPSEVLWKLADHMDTGLFLNILLPLLSLEIMRLARSEVRSNGANEDNVDSVGVTRE